MEPLLARSGGRREQAERTRARLTDAAIDVLFESGPGGLSTVKITRRAGIVQSGFYKHFRNIDECLVARAEDFERNVAVPINDAIRTIHGSDPFDEARWERMFLDVFDVFLREPRMTAVFLRYRRDPTPFGRRLARAIDHARSDLTVNLWALGSRFDVKRSHLPRIESLSDLLIGALLNAVEGIIDGRGQDRKDVARMLAHAVVGACVAELSALVEADPAPVWQAIQRRRIDERPR